MVKIKIQRKKQKQQDTHARMQTRYTHTLIVNRGHSETQQECESSNIAKTNSCKGIKTNDQYK